MKPEEFSASNQEKKFETPEEEIAFLREKIAQKEQEVGAGKEGEKALRDAAREQLEQYQKEDTKEILHENLVLSEEQHEAIQLDLSPEPHDQTMAELLGILQERGVKNALDAVAKMENPHITDDFHRFLVEYLRAGYPVQGLRERGPLAQDLRQVLFEIEIPEFEEDDIRNQRLSDFISIMEQLLAGLSTLSSGKKKKHDTFTLSIATARGGGQYIFYASVPQHSANIFEKQVLSVYPTSKVKEQKDDFNIFNYEGEYSGSIAQLKEYSALPILTHEYLEYDPMNVILNAFSRLENEDEGAGLQIVCSTADGDSYNKEYERALRELQEGGKKKKVFGGTNILKDIAGDMKDLLFSKDKDDVKPPQIDNLAVEQITEKLKTTVVETNIRVIASAATKQRSNAILRDIESSFKQFTNNKGNAFEFKQLERTQLKTLAHMFSFRSFNPKQIVPLSLRELATIFHFPRDAKKVAPQTKSAKARTAPVPHEVAREGILLGHNTHQGLETPVYYDPEDRVRHMYVIGQTGTGKTNILSNMIVQDIQNGDGCCFIDPHGSDVQTIMASVPKERYEDVIYFDPGHTARPMAFNMLEYDTRYPEQKTFVVNEMMSIFNKLFDMKTAGGPMFEQYFRNATMLVIEHPESGNTLLDVSRVLSDKAFRDMKLNNCKNPLVVQFWREIAEKAGGEGSLKNIVPYITSKFDIFLSNDIMRPIVAQERSSFDFRDVMDNQKILLVNLSKGRLGDINSSLLGLILVGKILMAALSRVDMDKSQRKPFYLYIDEFQNVTTDSISAILSEARKYKLSLSVAHQFIKQLDEGIRDAVFGNVGSMVVHRVGTEDAEFLQKQFEPAFTTNDIMNIPNFNSYVKMLAHGKPLEPFSMLDQKVPDGNPEIVESLKELSFLKYGRPRDEIEAEIQEQYKKKEEEKKPPARKPSLGGNDPFASAFGTGKSPAPTQSATAPRVSLQQTPQQLQQTITPPSPVPQQILPPVEVQQPIPQQQKQVDQQQSYSPQMQPVPQQSIPQTYDRVVPQNQPQTSTGYDASARPKSVGRRIGSK